MANVLFVCLHNAGRSQMSQALFESAANGHHHAASAGTHPANEINGKVLSVMNEIGIDLSHHKPKGLTDEMARSADVVVTMGCGDECPYIPGKRYVDWDLPDPTVLDLDEVRQLRDNISQRVKELIAGFDSTT